MTEEIVGRDEELRAIAAFLDEVDAQGPAAIVFEGEADIGKSTLWRAGIDVAHKRGLRVLASQPAEPERGLAHAGLGDLLEAVLDEALPVLAAPRRRALEVALLREPGERADPRALAVAVRDTLETLAGQEPTLVAVDDVHWLDPASSGTYPQIVRLTTPDYMSIRATSRFIKSRKSAGRSLDDHPDGPAKPPRRRVVQRGRLHKATTVGSLARSQPPRGLIPGGQ